MLKCTQSHTSDGACVLECQLVMHQTLQALHEYINP